MWALSASRTSWISTARLAMSSSSRPSSGARLNATAKAYAADAVSTAAFFVPASPFRAAALIDAPQLSSTSSSSDSAAVSAGIAFLSTGRAATRERSAESSSFVSSAPAGASAVAI